MDNSVLLSYIDRIRSGNQLESSNLDFKIEWWDFKSNGTKEFAKDVCTMANSHNGDSYIVIGVNDKTGEVVDSPLPLDEASLQEKLKSKINPRVNFTVSNLTIEDKIV